ncbi:MAG: outer membrane protein assembly factor BamB family protein [Planctomycetota bacterium]|jgi:outer membrane protein assembly factor BamB
MTEQRQPGAGHFVTAGRWHWVAIVLAGISGLFSPFLVVVLFANDFAVGSLDIANSVELQRAGERFDEHGGEEYARRVEDLDLSIRKEHTARRDLARKAKVALVFSLGIFLLSANAALVSRRKPPTPAAAGDREAEKVRQHTLGRWAVGACAVGIVLTALAAGVTFRPPTAGVGVVLVRPLGWAEGIPAVRPEPYGPPSWDEVARNWPHFRGPDGSGVCNFAKIPTAWNENQRLNIVWKVSLPLNGASSPVVWEDKLFLTAATKQQRLVLCYDAATGEVLWAKGYKDTGANNEIDVLDEFIYAAGTPAVDGRCVVAAFANGDVACFDMNGNELWARNLGDTSRNEYGYSSSPLLYEGKVIVQFDAGEQGELVALDVQTGEEIWRQDRKDKSWASPILVEPEPGVRQVVVAGAPTVSAWELETGRVIWWADVLEVVDGDVACSPILAAGQVIAVSDEAGMFAIRTAGRDDVKDSQVGWKVGKGDLKYSSFPDASSPVSDGELIYTYKDTMLVCIDAKSGKVVYEKEVGERASFASPVIAAGKLYLFAGKKTLIGQPGRQFKLLNTCELDESFDASPAFKEGRIFIRTRKCLYCIGEAG